MEEMVAVQVVLEQVDLHLGQCVRCPQMFEQSLLDSDPVEVKFWHCI